jgi:hypothetical protein
MELKLTFTRDEVAPMLGIKLGTLRRLESEQPHRLPQFVRVGRSTVYPREQIEDFLRAHAGIGGKPNAHPTPAPACAASIAMQKRGPGRPRKTARKGGAA